MSIIRLIIAIAAAAGVTTSLLLLMHFLITANLIAPKEGDEFKIPEIIMPEHEIKTEIDTSKPEKPEDPEEPPPEIPEPQLEESDVDSSVVINVKTGGNLDIGGMGGFGGDGDFLPIVKVAARYPDRALTGKGIEGYCTVIYTVTTSGETKDVRESDCPKKIFLRPSIKAAKKFKYKPRIINEEPVEVPDVENKFIFELPKDDKKR